jgi:hypothetical protein
MTEDIPIRVGATIDELGTLTLTEELAIDGCLMMEDEVPMTGGVTIEDFWTGRPSDEVTTRTEDTVKGSMDEDGGNTAREPLLLLLEVRTLELCIPRIVEDASPELPGELFRAMRMALF